MKEALRAYDQIKQTPDTAQKNELFHRILELQAENIWVLGLVGGVKETLIVKKPHAQRAGRVDLRLTGRTLHRADRGGAVLHPPIARHGGRPNATYPHRFWVTGASGYVGGRLVAALEGAGRRVRCVTRRPELAAGRFGSGTEVVAGDVLDADSMRRAMAGVGLAYYLVHSLGSRGRFEQEEERAARSFVAAAQGAGVRRIVYLGGLAHPDELARQAGASASAHMSSRLRVGEVLRGSGIPTVEFRASVVIGAGSLSFELIRALVQRLPAMITPRWVSVEAQPIAIADVIAYLVAALDLPLDGSRVFEIGGAEVTSYRGLMEEYARQRGLRRLFVPVPFLTPQLSSLWLGLVTPIFARVGRKLIESITMPSVVRDRSALDGFPVRPRGYRDAIRRALADEDARLVATPLVRCPVHLRVRARLRSPARGSGTA